VKGAVISNEKVEVVETAMKNNFSGIAVVEAFCKQF